MPTAVRKPEYRDIRLAVTVVIGCCCGLDPAGDDVAGRAISQRALRPAALRDVPFSFRNAKHSIIGFPVAVIIAGRGNIAYRTPLRAGLNAGAAI